LPIRPALAFTDFPTPLLPIKPSLYALLPPLLPPMLPPVSISTVMPAAAAAAAICFCLLRL
jgi:hypothetical protein